MNPVSVIELFLKNADQLKFKNLFFLVVSLFLIDLLIPDFIPFIDEIMLGLLAIILANWKEGKTRNKEGDLIEGEILDKNDDKKIR